MKYPLWKASWALGICKASLPHSAPTSVCLLASYPSYQKAPEVLQTEGIGSLEACPLTHSKLSPWTETWHKEGRGWGDWRFRKGVWASGELQGLALAGEPRLQQAGLGEHVRLICDFCPHLWPQAEFHLSVIQLGLKGQQREVKG